MTVCYLRDSRDDAFGVDELRRGAGRRLRRDRRTALVRSARLDQPAPARAGTPDRSRARARLQDQPPGLAALEQESGIVPLSTVHGWTGHSHASEDCTTRSTSDCSRDSRDWSPCRPRSGAELVRHGARPGRVTTILNGIDHDAFRRDPAREAAARESLGIDPRRHRDRCGRPPRAAEAIRPAHRGIRRAAAGPGLISSSSLPATGSERPRSHRLARDSAPGAVVPAHWPYAATSSDSITRSTCSCSRPTTRARRMRCSRRWRSRRPSWPQPPAAPPSS